MKKTIVSKAFLIIMALTLSFVFVACKKPEVPIVEVEKFTVIFDVNAGDDVVQNEPSTVRVDSGKVVQEPTPAPTRTGYVFEGWYENADGEGQPYVFSKPISKNNFKLYAKWSVKINYQDVTFNYSDDRPDFIAVVTKGSAVAMPETPTRENHRFEGWFIDGDFSSQYNFASSVDDDLTLYAKWTQLFSVTFEFNCDDVAVTQTVEAGSEALEPEVEDRIGYSFSGWFSDQALKVPYEFNAVSKNETVYAKWTEIITTVTFTVQFDLNYEGAAAVAIKTVPEGGIVSQTAPTREGYRFLGWYLDNETFLERFMLTTPVNSDLVLFANWVKTYKLSIDYNYSGAINPSDIVVNENTAIASPQSPSRIGYTFAGWSNSATGLIGYDLSVGINKNTKIYAQWSKTNIFEAEYLDFSDFFGWGFSGNATGTDAILEDVTGNAGVSNGRFVTYLYGNGITLEYEIYSDRAIDNVTLTLRLSGEIKDFYIQAKATPNMLEPEPVYTIKVNGKALNYSNIYFYDVPSQSANTLLPFKDFVISVNVSLKEGLNTIELITDNELLMGGTMGATAPMVDCLKLTTYAVLTWEPKLDNY